MAIHFFPFDLQPDNFQPAGYVNTPKPSSFDTSLFCGDDRGTWRLVKSETVALSMRMLWEGMFGHPSPN